MPCDCLEYICLEVIYNPCSEGAELAIEATETGTWSADLYFNGVPTQFSFGVTQGENIIIPAAFLNEYYIHELRLYNGGGILLGCYQLKARYSNTAGEFTPILPGDDSLNASEFEGNGTTTQTFPGIGRAIEITIGYQVYTTDAFVQVQVDGELTEQIIMNDGVTLYGTIVVKWENI